MGKGDDRSARTNEELEEAMSKLSPEEAEMFVRALELTLKRRRLLFTGYLAALLALVFGLASAAYVYGTREPGTFVGWVFLVPFAAVGLILTIFGRLAKRGVKSTESAPADAGQGPS